MAEIDLLKNSSFISKLESLTTAIENITPADGVSPTITLNKSGKVITISATDKNGSSSVTITEPDGDMKTTSFATKDATNGYVDKAIDTLKLGGKVASSYVTKDDLSSVGSTNFSGSEPNATKDAVWISDAT